MQRTPLQRPVSLPPDHTQRVTTLAGLMCGLIFVVYTAVLSTILRVGNEGVPGLVDVLPPKPPPAQPRELTAASRPKTSRLQRPARPAPPTPRLNARRSLDPRLNTDWENPWDGTQLFVKGGVARRYDIGDDRKDAERWLHFWPQGPNAFVLGFGRAGAYGAWLFGDDLLEIHISPDYFGLWKPHDPTAPPRTPASLAGTWNCEFFHATFTETVNLTFDAADEFPVSGRLWVRSEVANWQSPVAATFTTDADLMLQLRRSATGSSAIRSERFLVQLNDSHGTGLGERGGCVRLVRVDE